MKSSDLYTLKQNYINHIIGQMEIDSLRHFVSDAMMNGHDGIREWSYDDVAEDILDCYDQKTLDDLVKV